MFALSVEEIQFLKSIKDFCEANYPTIQIPNVSDVELAWLSGIVEGEGSYCFSKKSGNFSIQVQMCDEDIIKKVTGLFDTKLRKSYLPKGDKRKLVYPFCIGSVRAVLWTIKLYPFMGVRRRARILENIKGWMERPYYSHATRGSRLPAICHPDRPRTSLGKCKACYMKEYRKTYIRKDRPIVSNK